MRLSHYNCFLESKFDLQVTVKEKPELNGDEEIVEGTLINKENKHKTYSIKNRIPYFVSSDSAYTDTFGFQWNQFRVTQYDSFTGLSLSGDRLWNNTNWTSSELKDKLVLEVGSGAGRFTEVLLQAGATVISFDLSDAVHVNWKNNHAKGNLFLYKGDVYDIPFPDHFFDYVFCYGVLQHTPDPQKAYNSIFSKLKSKGKISVDYYTRIRLSPWSTPKYFWRPVTKKMSPKLLLKIIKFYIPFWLPVDSIIRRIPRIGNKIVALIPIPCWNYINSGLTYKQRKTWAILDTFDALSPEYDYPKTLDEVRRMIHKVDNLTEEVFYGSTGVVANVIKK